MPRQGHAGLGSRGGTTRNRSEAEPEVARLVRLQAITPSDERRPKEREKALFEAQLIKVPVMQINN
jgi:hypothetical protein